MDTPVAIPTIYKGIEFKSRLEAQTALLLNTMGLSYEYEAFSFMLSNGIPFRPDFWIGSTGLFIECRGTRSTPQQNVTSMLQLSEFARLIGTGGIRSLMNWNRPSGPEFLLIPGDSCWMFWDCLERGGKPGDANLSRCKRCSKWYFIGWPDGCLQCRHCKWLGTVPNRYLGTIDDHYDAVTKAGKFYFNEAFDCASLAELVGQRILE